MRKSIQDAIIETIQDMSSINLDTTLTQKELEKQGIEIPKKTISAQEIKKIRQMLNVSQAVFAKLLNVSLSTIRQWEQGLRKPSGSAVILLELLQQNPNTLDYRKELLTKAS